VYLFGWKGANVLVARKLGRTANHRRAMLRGLVTFLLEKGKIETTLTRAKEIRSAAEKIISIGKNASLNSKRKVFSYLTKENVVKRLFDEIVPKYMEVNGGYTRITRLGPRKGDAAEMVIIELI
jgi:large subunit ribosomal protein L17